MRNTLLSGLLLVVAAFIAVMGGAWLDLEVDQIALSGVAAGAVVALVPHADVVRRLGGFVVGVVLGLIGYFVRAALLPDTSGGRAVFAALTVALCVVVAAATIQRLPLWSLLLGAGTFAGAYEAAYNVAPPLILDTSINALTGLAMCVAFGFLAGSFAAPRREKQPAAPAARPNQEVLEGQK